MGNKINFVGSAFAMAVKSVGTAVFAYIVFVYLVGVTPVMGLSIAALIILAEAGWVIYIVRRKKV